MSIFRRTAMVGALLSLAAGANGCKSLECGPNTLQQGDQCVAEATDPGTNCGPGTVWNGESGRCENVLFLDGGGICGSNTTVVVSDAGVRTCVGTGGASGPSCAEPLPCPAPTGSLVSMCGRIYDLETTAPLDNGNATDGEPYRSIELRVYDPIAFVSNPNAPILIKGTADSCGRFRIVDAPRPATGFIAVATDDSPDGGDLYVQTGIAAPVEGGETLTGLRAWVLRRSTDELWSRAAGLPAGQTFGRLGVYIPIFLSGSETAPFKASPTSSVQVAIIDQGTGMRTVKEDRDFYFDDLSALERKQPSPTRSMTGANGTALYIMQPGLGSFSGLGNTPAGSCWAVNPAAAPVGNAYVQERVPGAEFCP